MKSLQELYDEIMASDELKKQFVALKPEQVEEFVKSQGCDATMDDITAFLKAKKNEDKELTLDELDNVAGGHGCSQTGIETAMSICSLGTVCALLAIGSVLQSDHHVGQQNEKEGRLCNSDKKPE